MGVTKIRRIVPFFLCLVLLLSLSALQGVKAEGNPGGTPRSEQVETVELTVTFGQTESRQMLEMVNNLRKSETDAWYWNSDNTEQIKCENLEPLQYDYELEKAAMQRAAETALYWDHTRTNGESCFTAYPTGYMAMGENIAAGSANAEATFKQWEEAGEKYSGQGHRRTMLSGNFNAIGIAHVEVNGVHYWVQELGSTSASTTATSAKDSAETVEMDVLLSYIKGTAVLKTSVQNISVEEGEAYNLPAIEAELTLTETWPSSAKRTVTTSGSSTIADSAIATVENGQLKGLKPGTTTLTIEALGQSISIPVEVTGKSCAHQFGAYTQTKAPTCTDAGLKERTCSLCGAVEEETIPALGHKTKLVDEKAAACLTEGYTGDRVCTVCGEMTEKGTVIPPKGHQYEYGTCAVCGAVDADYEHDELPYVEGREEDQGWDVIVEKVQTAQTGEDILVNMNGQVVVPKYVLRDIKGKDASIVIKLPNGISWTISGSEVMDKLTDDHVTDFNVSAEMNSGKIPSKKITDLAGTRHYEQLQLAHDGQFGFRAVLTIPMGITYKERQAKLYHYNEETQVLELQGTSKIDENGNVQFTLTHASDYVVIVDDPAAVDKENPSNSEKDETSPATGAMNMLENQVWIGILLFGTAAAIFGTKVVTAKKKKN